MGIKKLGRQNNIQKSMDMGTLIVELLYSGFINSSESFRGFFAPSPTSPFLPQDKVSGAVTSAQAQSNQDLTALFIFFVEDHWHAAMDCPNKAI